MKEKLVALLKENVAVIDADDFIDDLAEDIMAVIIRAINPFADDAVEDVEHAVIGAYNSRLGASLHNLLFVDDTVPNHDVTRISKAMLQTMLLELPGATIKRRLQELNASTLIN